MLDEEAKWSWDGVQPDSKFVIDYVSVSHPDMVTVPGMLPAPRATSTPSPIMDTPARRMLDVSPASSAFHVDHDDALIRYRSVREIMEATLSVASGDVDEDLLLVDIDEPGSFQEARGYECW
jgi:hypothetical protein